MASISASKRPLNCSQAFSAIAHRSESSLRSTSAEIVVEAGVEDLEDEPWRDESEHIAPPTGRVGEIERAVVEVGPEAKTARVAEQFSSRMAADDFSSVSPVLIAADSS